jgi:hypothetical protein
MKCFIVLEAKQGGATMNHVMCTLVTTLSHIGHRGKVGAGGRLVSSYFLHCFQ